MPELTRIGAISELAPGDTLLVLDIEVDTLQLVRYCGASGDYNRQHWDMDHMRGVGFPGVIVHGWLTFALMCRALAAAIPREIAEIARYSVRYHAPAYPALISCGGEVVAVRADGHGGEAELELWARDRERGLLASAKVTLRFA